MCFSKSSRIAAQYFAWSSSTWACVGSAHCSTRIGAPIADDFVLALRSEARDDDLGVSAALPLLTVAALLGELELVWPLRES